MRGKLYGIGAGPGDPELMTVKAIRCLEQCDVVAVPDADKGSSTVYQIGISYIADSEEDDVDEILGYYETEDEAKAAVKNSPFYRDFKKHFVIDRYTVDEMEWREGFS